MQKKIQLIENRKQDLPEKNRLKNSYWKGIEPKKA